MDHDTSGGPEERPQKAPRGPSGDRADEQAGPTDRILAGHY
jgi:hypothetical protein